MKTNLLTGAVIGLLAGTMGAVWADSSTVFSTPQGYIRLQVTGRSDTLMTTPLLQPATGIGVVNGFTANTVSLAGSELIAGQFTPQTGTDGRIYYLEFNSGALEGVRYKILGNSENTLTVDTGTETLVNHPLGTIRSGDVVRIRSNWTVGQVFGATDDSILLTPFAATPTPTQVDTSDSILFSDNETSGLMKSPTLRLFYQQSVGWRTVGDTSTDYGIEPLPPGRVFRVRRFSGESLDLYMIGMASRIRSVVRIPAGDETHGNDVFVGLLSASPLTLSNSALVQSNASTSALQVSPATTQREDELLSWGTRAGFNREPEREFFYLDGQGWREVGSSSITIGEEFALEPGKGYLLRKRTSDSLHYWLISPQN